MLSAAKVPLFFWAEALATACFTQNRSLVIPRHEKTPYHIINDRKPSFKFFHIFGSVCYIVRDGKNLDKMKEKGDECKCNDQMMALQPLGKDESNSFVVDSLLKTMWKKVIITEATVREALRLDDAKSKDCLPNEEIFTELSRMGVGKGFSGVETPLFEGMIVAQQANDVAAEVAAGVDVNDVFVADVEPFLPSPTPTTQPPPPSQELPSTSQVIPTPPPSPIAKPSSPL
nr:retrovirus-related Pol polyprotein from transposon TNT 1-94 [Tanacetum cinerariifolium]